MPSKPTKPTAKIQDTAQPAPTSPERISTVQDASPEPITAVQPAPIDWEAARDKYIDGVCLQDIASIYHVDYQVVQERAWRDNWKAAQSKAIERLKPLIEAEIKQCFLVSVLREAREYRDSRLLGALEPDVVSKCRTRCYELASKLFGWDMPQAVGGARAKLIDV